MLEDAQVKRAAVLGAGEVEVYSLTRNQEVDKFGAIRAIGEANRYCALGIASVQVYVLMHQALLRQEVLEEMRVGIDADLVNERPLLGSEEDSIDFVDRNLVKVDDKLTERALLSSPAKLLEVIDNSLALRFP